MLAAQEPAVATWQRQQLTYCANVHPCTDLAQQQHNLQQWFSAVREQRQLRQMNSGLWLANNLADEILANDSHLAQFKTALQHNGVRLTTLNGFPFGDFHADVVKDQVYLPDWADSQRLNYTKDLASLLARCMPQDETLGSISTLPLGYKARWNKSKQDAAAEHLAQLAQYLQTLEIKTGKQIIVCLEMEPDCALEATPELLQFFEHSLIPQAKRLGLNAKTVLTYIGCCIDTCHQAVMYEPIADSLAAIHRAGIRIGKIQLSNAVQCRITRESDIDTLCTTFQDAKFMHQCKLRSATGDITDVADLNYYELFNELQQQPNGFDCTLHYHVPIHQRLLTPCESNGFTMNTTQQAILDTLDFLQANPSVQPQLEIETYTWLNLLNNAGDDALINGLLAEFTWLEAAMQQRHLLA